MEYQLMNFVDEDRIEADTNRYSPPPKEVVAQKRELQLSPIEQRNSAGEDLHRHGEYEQIKLK